MIETPNIPTEVLDRAHRRPNGEFAWTTADAPAAVVALAAAGYAVLGGEWWVVLPDGAIWPATPTTKTGPAHIYGWSVRTGWDRENESWLAFCERVAAYTLAVLRGEDPDSSSLPAIETEVRRTHPDLWPHVYYNLTFTSRDDYGSRTV